MKLFSKTIGLTIASFVTEGGMIGKQKLSIAKTIYPDGKEYVHENKLDKSQAEKSTKNEISQLL